MDSLYQCVSSMCISKKGCEGCELGLFYMLLQALLAPPYVIIGNQKLDVQLAFEKVNTTKEALRKSLKKRKEMEIKKNETQYKEETIE